MPGPRYRGVTAVHEPTAAALPPLLADLGDPADAAAVRARLAARDVPIHDGLDTTFLYVGDAERVALQHWMDDFPPLPAFIRVAGTDVWYLTVRLPEGARIDYKLAVWTGGRRRLVLDGLNPNRAHDPFGVNSVVAGPGYRRPDWTRSDPAVPSGRVEELPLDSAAFGEERVVRLYLPAGYPNHGDHPLLVVHDGGDYLRYSGLRTVLDNLIAAGEVAPLVAALVDPGERSIEYTGDDRHAAFLAEEVVPAVTAHAAVTTDPRQRGLMGASLGGVASLHAAWRHPGTWEALLLQSGSFVTALGGKFRRGRVFAPVVAFMGHFLADPGRLPARVFMSCGRYDGLAADNRRMAAALGDFGADVTYEEARDGHTWENWRDRLRTGLGTLFPGPVGPGASLIS